MAILSGCAVLPDFGGIFWVVISQSGGLSGAKKFVVCLELLIRQNDLSRILKKSAKAIKRPSKNPKALKELFN